MQESRREEIGRLDETFDEFFPSSFSQRRKIKLESFSIRAGGYYGTRGG